jgi:DNA-binding MarR family transcriptional regulator
MPKQYYKVAQYKSRRSIGYLLRHASKLITGRIEGLFVSQDVNFVQWVILMHLRDDISKTAAELSQHLCHDSGALTRIIDQMEERGLVTRTRSTEDRRMVSLQLTEAGHAVIHNFLPRMVDYYNSLLTDFTAEETDTLIDLLTRLIAKISASPSTPVTES